MITFTCLEGDLGNPVFLEETSDCQYLFEWATSAACPVQPAVGSNCVVTDGLTGFTFDMNVLQGVYNLSDRRGHKYSLGVCGAQVPCNNQMVDACQGSSDNRTFSMGTDTDHDIVFNDGVLTLTYDGGDFCHNHRFRRAAIINFVCAPNVSGVGFPQFVSETANCTYIFIWRTPAACITLEKTNCVVADNMTNVYDLQPLARNMPPTGWPSDDGKYTFGICAAIPNNPTCGHFGGACAVWVMKWK